MSEGRFETRRGEPCLFLSKDCTLAGQHRSHSIECINCQIANLIGIGLVNQHLLERIAVAHGCKVDDLPLGKKKPDSGGK